MCIGSGNPHIQKVRCRASERTDNMGVGMLISVARAKWRDEGREEGEWEIA